MAKDRLDFTIRTKNDLEKAVRAVGFLPFFSCQLAGLSVEEHAAPGVWFDGSVGVWEWKGPVIRETGCAYGKFFDKRAAFISAEWFPDFANYRRDGYDFDARFDDGLASYRDRELYELVAGNSPVLSKELKRLGDYRKGGKKGFETILTRLQAQCYVVVSDFVYLKDKQGREYGWGVAEYAVPEQSMGSGFSEEVYRRTPEESRQRILGHLRGLLPGVPEDELLRFLGR